METNNNEQKKKTKFEELLSQMSLEDKSTVFDNLKAVEDLFSNYAERAGYKWLNIVSQDKPLEVIFICTSIAGGIWYSEYRKKEGQDKKQES